ncbi:MAG: hypothetical protein A3B99_03115 [Candidatus Yanofskybacteria bacterium RIFCSPHIGHO2_02_FULL_44_12b]|uniref:ATP-dependent DNA helicase RecG n=1 Tax=Candidatus Yanofskybacteria bacterium RIFCSPLOWO2_01_FULL_44_22 TaxID=1802697 RepID=A0A1F8GMG6_9BACT|nr:MAG: hypothetical protein A2659_02890 [Candidatus Yanofskybacteria bacterium RIFCSPHIGHO2_01_FULL_44_24]OGN15062.1 MAG: hypothetical protein A3B99_03115 [Candidatus Yanofskybacteria bacterium RIFCSPHIGHO2_02_FULL_44_12b]OGN26531.1 MAG: hypothetical protein A2925_03260 [Candidatus Yanofskybacteria bacterium RIFCSPLOWO2_01_FULL_44_22]
MDPSLSIEKLKNVGPRNLSRLYNLGIKTLKDLLWHFPVRYEDYTQTLSISNIEPGQKVNVQGQIVQINSRRIFPRRMSVTNAIVQDSTGAVKVVWFNQPYIEETLPEGTFVSLAGKVNLDKHGLYLSSPAYEKIVNNESGAMKQESGIKDSQPTIHNSSLKHTSGLVPVYPETEGVTSKYLRFLIKPLLKTIKLNDPLPPAILQKYNLPQIDEAMKTIHYPLDPGQADLAKERFAFEDLLLFQLKALLERRKLNQLKSISIKFDQEFIKDFISKLPFELTKDQKIATLEILKDIEKSYPMNRLLEGDVGSGKTVVALIAAMQIAKAGFQTVFMVPTEVLANQHFKTVSSLAGQDLLRVGLLTSSACKLNGSDFKRSELKKEIADGGVDLIIGTHAVIQKDVSFKNLAMVVIDEQHRFGIQQRAALVKNSNPQILNDKQAPNSQIGNSQQIVPHLLSMTATPIPRTLALTIYGDLDISLIKEKPKNRQKIITKIVSPSKVKEAYRFVRDEVAKGRQAFVVCPRIEVSDPRKEIKVSGERSKMNILWADVKAVEEEYQKLSGSVFPELQVAMLHGKLKSKEKDEIMKKFKDGDFDILVSTSVIEVGVDVPNASIMMIESAERFGLAQLHQFRGRVGRSEHQSYCLLISSTSDKSVNQRLKALEECDDGFELAEKDMSIRGPGEFFGVKQSGIPDLGMASLANVDLIKKARLEARLLLKENPSLTSYPLLKDRLESFQKLTHFE